MPEPKITLRLQRVPGWDDADSYGCREYVLFENDAVTGVGALMLTDAQHEAMESALTENAGLREALEAAREGLAAANPYWRIRSDRAEAERDAMRPVVDLVRLVIEHQRPGAPAGLEWESRRDQLWTSLAAAVDSYTQSSFDVAAANALAASSKVEALLVNHIAQSVSDQRNLESGAPDPTFDAEALEPDVIALANHPLHDVWAAGGDASTSRDFRDKEGELDETAYVRYGLNVMRRTWAAVEAQVRAKVAAEIRAGITASVTTWNITGSAPTFNGEWYRADHIRAVLDRIEAARIAEGKGDET